MAVDLTECKNEDGQLKQEKQNEPTLEYGECTLPCLISNLDVQGLEICIFINLVEGHDFLI